MSGWIPCCLCEFRTDRIRTMYNHLKLAHKVRWAFRRDLDG